MRQPEYYVFTVSKGSRDQTKHTFVSAGAAAKAVVSGLHSCEKVGFGASGQGEEWLKRVEDLHVAITLLSANPPRDQGTRAVMTGIV